MKDVMNIKMWDNMLKVAVAALVAFLAVATVALACAAMVICPYHGTYAQSDGYVFCENGRAVCKYWCPRKHYLQEICK